MDDEIRVAANWIKEQAVTKRIIGFTSPRERQGKSQFILLVSRCLMERGKVLIIDYNMFEPRLSKELAKHAAKDLYGLLYDAKEQRKEGIIEDYIYPTSIEGISVLPWNSRIKRENYISACELKIVMRFLRSTYDYILIEMPSFEELSYVQDISEIVDDMFLVIRKGAFKISEMSVIKEKMNKLGKDISHCVFVEEMYKDHLISSRLSHARKKTAKLKG